jgi:hypothetical protein
MHRSASIAKSLATLGCWGFEWPGHGNSNATTRSYSAWWRCEFQWRTPRKAISRVSVTSAVLRRASVERHFSAGKDRNFFQRLPFLSVVLATGDRMKIVEHSESHIVKLDDGSTWQIFAGDIDQTLAWLPTTELWLFEMNDEVASHALINCDDGTHVRARPQGEEWPMGKLKDVLKKG